MDNDDRPVGRILSRREVLALFGAAGAIILSGCVSSAEPSTVTPPSSGGVGAGSTEAAALAPAMNSATLPTPLIVGENATATTPLARLACVVSPELTEGPYFVDERLNRSDIRPDPATGLAVDGALLDLTVRVSRVGAGGCEPLADAVVDVWHCDASGVYSGVSDPGFRTVGQQFLRGYQVTDNAGEVHFTTIYPGWYRGRAVHIHFKVRGDHSSGRTFEFTSQWFFDESLTDVVHAREPYVEKGRRTLLNDGDGIFRDGGEQLILDVSQAGDDYSAIYDIGIQVD